MAGSPRFKPIVWCLIARVAVWPLARVAAAQADPPPPPGCRIWSAPSTACCNSLPPARRHHARCRAQQIMMSVSRISAGREAARKSPRPPARSRTVPTPMASIGFAFAVDAKGRSRGGDGPDVAGVVDAAGPKVAARVWKGGDGEIICRYAATNDSLRMESLKVGCPQEPRLEGRRRRRRPAREAPAHMVGEDIWWAGRRWRSLPFASRSPTTPATDRQTIQARADRPRRRSNGPRSRTRRASAPDPRGADDDIGPA